VSLVEQWAAEGVATLSAHGLLRRLEPLESPQGPVVTVKGQTLVNFSSNDYLGLAADETVRQALRDGSVQHGVGSGASRLLVGDTTAHQALEQALADFEDAETALLFNSGYAANTGVLPALLGPEDVVFSDELNHASLIDGCRLSRAKVVVYPHGNVAALASLVTSNPGRRRLVVTDAVFSMDGDPAPLKAIADLCEATELGLMVDEAHATGVLGPTGAGLSEAEGVKPDLRMGTLSKALGCFGAWVAGPDTLRTYLLNTARSLVFSTALPAPVCAAAMTALARLRVDATLRNRLWHVIRRFSQGLAGLGLPTHESSAIFSVVLGTPERALAASSALRRRGVLARAIRPPTVPRGTSRLRFAVSAAHTDEQIDQAIAALGEVMLEVGGAQTAPGV